MPYIALRDEDYLILRAYHFIGTEGLSLALFEGADEQGRRYVFSGDVSCVGDLIEDVWDGRQPLVAVPSHLIIQGG